ncbi:MAG: CRTAC1 family protein [Gemmataceae bacterium]
MSRTFKQAIITLFFLAQLVAVWALNHTGPQAKDEGAETALRNFGFYLKECAGECGIDFKHESPRELDPKLSHIAPIIASMGAAVSVVDFDRDGWPDLYVVTSAEGGKNRLYRNLRNGKFEDVAEKVGLADLNARGTGVCQGAVWGDFDNDGWEDVLVYRWGKPELFRNDGGKRFVRVTEKAGLPVWVNANSAIWVDYDCDGQLDLLIAGYWPDDVNLWDLKTTKMMPDSFEYAKNGGRKYLLRNKGDGSFEDVTKQVGMNSNRWTLGLAAADICGTGYPDIVFANDYGVSEFFCNKGGKRFEEIGQYTRIGETPKSGMNVSFGDIFNEGKFSIYVSNISEPGNLVQGNNLWVPEKAKPGEAPRYRNFADADGFKVSLGGWSWSAQFGDLNNDGLQDLFLTNGYISADPKDTYWFEYGKIAGGHGIIIEDAQNWPAIRGRSLGGFQQKYLWMNRGGEFTRNIAASVGLKDTHDGRAVALVDLWNRGVLDVVVANQNGPLLVYKNRVADGRDWVQFELEGKRSNKSAIGALVRVFWNMNGASRLQEQVQVVSGGNAYASQNMRRLHFGLGEGAKVEKVVIQWPSGERQVLTAVKANVLHKIAEPTP